MNRLAIVGIIAVAAIAIVAAFCFTINDKQDVCLEVLGDSVPEESIVYVKLSDLNGSPITNKKINISVYNKGGSLVSTHSGSTDPYGKVSLSLKGISKGLHTIEAQFDGDEKYSANKTEKVMEITEKDVGSSPEVSQKSSQDSDDLPIWMMTGT